MFKIIKYFLIIFFINTLITKHKQKINNFLNLLIIIYTYTWMFISIKKKS
jgi:hypothetical protein